MAYDFPNSPTLDQTFTPSGGPTYKWNGTAWTAVNIVRADDYIASVPHDMRATFVDDAGTKYFVVNDKADGSGTQVLWVSETGSVFCATLDTTGNVRAGSGVVVGHVTQLLLGTSSGGSGPVALRPNGWDSGTGEFIVYNTGTARANGALQAMNNVIAGNGALFLRPNDTGNAAGQLTVDTSGWVDGTTFRTPGNGNGYLHGNLINKAARSGGYGASTFTCYWTSAMQTYIDDTYCGNMAFTSDYRIKKDVADLPSTWAQVKALRPISYTMAEFQPPASDEVKAMQLRDAIERYATERGVSVEDLPEKEKAAVKAPAMPGPLFKADDIPRWGFIAHELQEALLPEAATGTKDMLDGVQSPNWPPLVAALTKALQETMERVEALEATILTLRGNPDG